MDRNAGNPKGYVRLDPKKVKRRMQYCRMSKSELADAADVDSRTIENAISGRRCQAGNAYRIARALGLPRHEDLMPGEDDDGSSNGGKAAQRTFGEWIVLDVLAAWDWTSNRLQYEVCKMQHRFVTESFGRGKCYNLRYMSDDERSEAKSRLARHPAVCDRIGRHSAIPRNKRADYEGKDYFWVIDAWEDGPTLSEVVEEGPLESERLRTVMLQLAEGLHVLHKNGIVRRELTPEFIILRASDGSVLLTDLELAKLLDGSPTVSRDWKENPYVAPEVFGGKIDESADLFSWGQILYYAATGKDPPKLPGPNLFDTVALPKSIREIGTQCVDIRPSMRPRSIQKVIKVCSPRNWR
jgi:serine/threonine protein kinase